MSTPRSPASSLRRNTLALLAFWLLAGALLWAGFEWYGQRQRAALEPYVEAGGQLVIPRSPDGHFYAPGEVNRQPVRFLVDTGASGVAVSNALARAAGLPEGAPITLRTAAGERPGRLVHDVPVRVGPLARNDISVVTGLQVEAPDEALLGQSFLRHFQVTIDGNRMLLRTP